MVSVTTSCWKGMFLLALFIANFDEFVIASCGGKCKADDDADWSFDGKNNGPDNWKDKYPACGGDNQSPIDIVTENVRKDCNLAPLKLENYNTSVTKVEIKNDGKTITVTPQDGVNRTIYIQDEPSNLIQFHFHWGCDKTKGSEHTINGESYALELHFVYNNTRGNLSGLVIFYKEQETSNNTELDKITELFPKAMYKNDTTQLDSSLDLRKLMPDNEFPFCRYTGSIAAPPCPGGIIWNLAKDIMVVNATQMNEFRKLYSVTKTDANGDDNKGCKMSGNFRPVQPLTGRTVCCSA